MRMTALRSLSLPAWGSSLSCLPTTLEKLNISYHPGMSPGALPLTTRLTTLNASNTLLDDQALAPLTSLTRLDIKGCSAVTDAALSRLTNLRRLCLYCMEQIGDEGLAPLTALTPPRNSIVAHLRRHHPLTHASHLSRRDWPTRLRRRAPAAPPAPPAAHRLRAVALRRAPHSMKVDWREFSGRHVPAGFPNHVTLKK